MFGVWDWRIEALRGVSGFPVEVGRCISVSSNHLKDFDPTWCLFRGSCLQFEGADGQLARMHRHIAIRSSSPLPLNPKPKPSKPQKNLTTVPLNPEL